MWCSYITKKKLIAKRLYVWPQFWGRLMCFHPRSEYFEKDLSLLWYELEAWNVHRVVANACLLMYVSKVEALLA
jgi:hypothetical protein